jgi:outer membrane lipoprotein-sorting protein
MGALKNMNGRKIQFVTLNPMDSNSEIIKVELGIDAKTKHIYKLLQTGANGAKTSFTITDFKSNQPLSENLFKFDKQKYLSQQYMID